MLNLLKTLIVISLVVTSIVESYIRLWIMREILSLFSLYYVLESYKPFCRRTIIQFIFVMFQFSILMLIRVLLNMTFLVILRVIRKLRVMPFHSPIFALRDLLKTHSFLYVFVLPKLPYYLMSEFGTGILVLPVWIIIILSLSFSLKENLIISLTISSTLMLILFNQNTLLRVINFVLLIIWAVFLTSRMDYSSGEESSSIGFLTLSVILPLPRSYSMIIKYYLSVFPSLALGDVIFLVLVRNLSMFYMIKYISGFSKISGVGGINSIYMTKSWSMYTLGVYVVSLILVLWL